MPKASLPGDFQLRICRSQADSYELSSVLRAKVSFDGTLELLTSGWRRILGYGQQELGEPVHVRVRCRNGSGMCFRLHRQRDPRENTIYILAEGSA